MALLLTEEYLPSNIYDGTAKAKTDDGYDIAQPWIDVVNGVTRFTNPILRSFQESLEAGKKLRKKIYLVI